MRLLELFSGTQSVGKVAKKKGYEVISLDINDYKGKYPPTHKVDILEWDYKQYPSGYFDVIWASPPCLYYSILQYCWLGREKRINGVLTTFTEEMLDANILLADEWVLKTFEILDYFKPNLWFIENPQTSRLKDRYFMEDLPYYDVDYCKYSDWGYRKRTRIWTNKENFNNKLCSKKKHPKCVAFDFHGIKRYRVPEKLINELI